MSICIYVNDVNIMLMKMINVKLDNCGYNK